MPIVGCYDLALYCDNENVEHKYGAFPEEFQGHSRAEAVRNARKAGWVVNLKEMKCYCPECKKKNLREAK